MELDGILLEKTLPVLLPYTDEQSLTHDEKNLDFLHNKICIII